MICSLVLAFILLVSDENRKGFPVLWEIQKYISKKYKNFLFQIPKKSPIFSGIQTSQKHLLGGKLDRPVFGRSGVISRLD
ncbi:hypothetical protein CH373_01465 [Leptospira perolatii]|uniref:Uncharacterized protein n=1 Tax=Leptospira perolatii TaxID=2023191 RepID=A0A2M9ZRQ2_9LEPT|nr:hypothetical protein CH360_01465 [Leptospira perolatii]PJZ74742.1 hypothetical protein CH373_01465 [Leptospira perolatii]